MKNVNWKNVGFYLVLAFLTFMIGSSGITKLMGMQEWVEAWELYGYQPWFMYFIGALQIVTVIMLWIPKLRFWGADIIAIVMLGAAYTNFNVGEYAGIIQDVIILVLCGIVMWVTWDSFTSVWSRVTAQPA
ncbi:MAG: DoxX family protein [Chloroflexota bacterium]